MIYMIHRIVKKILLTLYILSNTQVAQKFLEFVDLIKLRSSLIYRCLYTRTIGAAKVTVPFLLIQKSGQSHI
jgi:hypothetical protein